MDMRIYCIRRNFPERKIILMTEKLKIAVIGGDERQSGLCKLLADDGHKVFAFALERAKLSENIIQETDITRLNQKFDCAVLPIPVYADPTHLNAPLSLHEYNPDDLFAYFPSGQMIIAGKVNNSLFEKAGRNGLRLYDYLEREDFNVLNSVATAEGAIHTAMCELNYTLNGKRCLVIGYGHIGKLLCRYLYGLGVDVTASARKSGDLSWINAYGYNAVETSKIFSDLSSYDIIFNTVPKLILDEKALLSVKQDAFICDLASKPGGVDFNFAKQLGIKTIHALSLPGKYSPASAADAMRKTIYNILDEWRD